MKKKKIWLNYLLTVNIPIFTLGGILLPTINYSSLVNHHQLNFINNEMNHKVANDELIKSSTTHNNNNVISLADTKYNQFQNSIVNLAPWKRLVGKNKILCFPEEVVHTKSGQIDLMYTNINADHSISEPKIVKINFNDSTNYTDIYYSGGCYSEAIDKFIIVISIKSIYNDWFPVFITIDDNNEAELNSSQLFVDIRSEENHKNKSLMVSNLSGSLINKQYPMAILSKDITSAIGSYNVPNFRVVEFQKPDSLIADPTFLIYLYAPGVYNKLNFLATDTGAITNGWGQHVFQTCVSISSSNQVTWKPNLLKNDTRYYNFLKAKNWDNPIINITPFFTNDINRPQFIGMYQESIQTFNNGKRRQTFVETYDMANKTPFTNPSDFINVKREIACNDMNGQRINNLATSKVVTWLSNSSIDYNTTKVLMYNATNKMDLIFVSDSNKGSYDGGFIATQYFTSNSSEQNLIDDSINWMWNIAYGINGFYDISYTYNLSPSELLSFYLNESSNKFVNMDIKSYYFDIRNKKMYFLINYLKWNNGDVTSNVLDDSKPIFVTLDFAKYSSANSTFFNYQFPTNNASFTNKINNGDFLDYLINRNNTVASSFNMLPSTAYREYTEGSFHLKSFPIMIPIIDDNYLYTNPITKEVVSSNIFFNQQADNLNVGNFGTITKDTYFSEITNEKLLASIKTDLRTDKRFFNIGNLFATPINQNPLGALAIADQTKIYNDRLNVFLDNSLSIEFVDTTENAIKQASSKGQLRFKVKLSYYNDNGTTVVGEKYITNQYNNEIFTINGLKIPPLTTINNNGLINATNSPIGKFNPKEIVANQNHPEGIIMSTLTNYLNDKKHSILSNLPIDAIISIAPNSIQIVNANQISLKIKSSIISTPSGIENDKYFDIAIDGLSASNITSLISQTIDVTNTPLQELLQEVIVANQNNPNENSVKTLINYLNEIKDKIFNQLPINATISIVPNSMEINDQQQLALKIQVSQIETVTGIESNKQFDIVIVGLDQTIYYPTTLKISTIDTNLDITENNEIATKELFNNIWTNDKCYAIDWACMDEAEQKIKKEQLINFVNANPSIFFNYPSLSTPIIITDVQFDFSKINTNYSVKINLKYYGYENNVVVDNLEGSIKLILQTIDDNMLMKYLINPNGIIHWAIKNWKKENPEQTLNQEQLKIIIRDILNQPITNNDNNLSYFDLLPNKYLPLNIVIDINKVENDSKNNIIIPKGTIQFTPNELNSPLWGAISNIECPEYDLTITPPNEQPNNNKKASKWWIWLIITGAAAVFIILVALIIIFIVKSKKEVEADE